MLKGMQESVVCGPKGRSALTLAGSECGLAAWSPWSIFTALSSRQAKSMRQPAQTWYCQSVVQCTTKCLTCFSGQGTKPLLILPSNWIRPCLKPKIMPALKSYAISPFASNILRPSRGERTFFVQECTRLVPVFRVPPRLCKQASCLIWFCKKCQAGRPLCFRRCQQHAYSGLEDNERGIVEIRHLVQTHAKKPSHVVALTL